MTWIGPTLPTQTCSIEHSLAGHTAAVLSVKFTKNGRYILSGSQDKSVRLWNPHTGTHVKTYIGPHNHEINDVVVTDDNSKFFSCGGDKQFFQWDVTTAQVIRKFYGHDRKVNALALGPNQDIVISASHDKTVRIWDLRARARGPIQTLDDASDSVLCLCVNGDEIVTGSTDGVLRRYDVRKGLLVVDQLLQPVGSVGFSNDRECALISTLDDKIRLLECETGNELALYTGHTNKKFKIQSTLDPSNAYVISGSEDNRICIWDLAEAGDLVASLPGHGGPVLCASFFESTLVTSAVDGGILVWASSLHSLQTASIGKEKGPSISGFVRASDESLPTAFGKRCTRQASARESGEVLAAVDSSSLVVAPERIADDPPHEDTEAILETKTASQQAEATTVIKKRGDRGKKNKRKRGTD